MTTDYKASGLTCEHCVHAVSKELNTIPSVSSVAVDLVPNGVSTIHITSAAPLDKNEVAAAVEEAGYKLVS